MKITKVSNEHFRYTKSFDVTDRYVIAYTGRSVSIFNKQLELLTKIDGLKYAYEGYLSPDESKLLVVSIINVFYLISLEDFSVTKVRVGGGYTENLQGLGCWSQDSRFVYIPIRGIFKVPYSGETLLSTVRKYDICDTTQYTDYLQKQYCIHNIVPVVSQNKILLEGWDLKTLKTDDGISKMIWFDGENAEVYDIRGYIETTTRISVNEEAERVILYSYGDIVVCDYKGNILESSDGDASQEHAIFPCSLDEIRQIAEKTKMYKHRIEPLLESVQNVMVSETSSYMYIGTDVGLVVVDRNDMSKVAEYRFEYGVDDIAELPNNHLLVSNSFRLGLLKIEP